MAKKNFTPTQELILEVLAARRRLGERIWPFDSVLMQALNDLEKRGFVLLMSGQVENSVRAELTDAGFKFVGSETYVSPLEQEKLELEKDIEALRRIHRLT